MSTSKYKQRLAKERKAAAAVAAQQAAERRRRMMIGGGIALPRPSWVSYAAQATLLGISAPMIATAPGGGGAVSWTRRASRVGTNTAHSIPLSLPTEARAATAHSSAA